MKIPCTGIGSLPYKDPEIASRFVLDNFALMPFWPQLPMRDFRENMYAQYAEGMPCVKFLEEEKKVIFDIPEDPSRDLESFYEKIISEDPDHFMISPRHAAGLYSFIRVSRSRTCEMIAAKGHVTGPVSFGLTVTDQNLRPVFYHDHFREVIVKALCMKARWQIRELIKVHPRVVVFIDEPYLASYGSAFVSLQKEEVMGALTEVINAIHSEGAKSGIHCCGNTDWAMLMDTGINIINFDAYGYTDQFLLYTDKMKEFLAAGGTIAWGIVPASEEIYSHTAESLRKRFRGTLARLEEKGMDRDYVLRRSIITPSCGTASLSEKSAAAVLKLTGKLAEDI